MAITLGTLLVELKAETAAFSEGLDKAGQLAVNKADDMKKAFALAGAAIASAMAAASATLVEFTDKALENADRMAKLSQSAGLSVESLTALSYAAKLSDVDSESLGISLEKLSKNMALAAVGGNQQAAAFQALGIAVLDSSGHLKSVDDIITEVAQKFSSMQDGAGKTALAMQLFGRSGAQMVPLLNQGAEGIQKLTAEAQSLGVVLDEKTALAAEKFEDDMKRLQAAQEGVGNAMIRVLAPTLDVLTEKMLEYAKSVDADGKITEILTYSMKGLGEVLLGVVGLFDLCGESIKFLAAELQLLASRDFAGARQEFSNWTNEIGATFNKQVSAMRDVWNASLENMAASSERHKGTLAAPVAGLKDQLIDLRGHLGAVPDDMASMMGALQAKQKGTPEGPFGMDAVWASIDAQNKKLSDSYDVVKQKALQVYNDTRTPLEQYNARIMDLTDLLNQGAINEGTFDRAALKAASDLDEQTKKTDTFTQAVMRMGDQLGQALLKGELHGTTFLNILKSMIVSLGEFILKTEVLNQIQSTTGIGGFFRSFISGLAGGRASGGPVSAGQGYMVGENGPEPFFPSTDGYILPNSTVSGGGGGAVFNYTIDARGATPGTEQRIMQALRMSEDRSVARSVAAVQEYSRRT